MKRTPIKRSSKRINPRSEKREAIAQERREFVARIIFERPYCQGPALLALLVREGTLSHLDRSVVSVTVHDCGRRSTEVHEKLKRSRGGSILDPENVLALCHSCHRFTESEPRLATLAGMLTPSWEKR